MRGFEVFVAGEYALNGFLFATSLYSSPNGIDWTPTGATTNAPFNGITYADCKFIALAGLDGGSVLVSTNGFDWSHSGYGGLQLNGVTFGNGSFVAVRWYYSSPAAIAVSSDGITWSNRNSGTSQFLNGVTSGGGLFVAVGQDGILINSSDTTNWFTQSIPTSQNLNAIAYGNGTFVAVGDSGTIVKSSDSGWTNLVANSFALSSIAYGNGQFATVGPGGKILSSSDGISWTNRNSGITSDLNAILFTNNLFIAIGSSVILTSSNAINWNISANFSASTIAFGNNLFVAFNAPTSQGLILSSNGTTWTRITTTVNPFAITFGKGLFVGVGGFGPILTSNNGTNWNSIANPGDYLSSAAFGNGQFVITGDASIYTSSDGVTWSQEASSLTQNGIGHVFFGNGLFLLQAPDFSILSSPDGTNWTKSTSGVAVGINDITYGAGTFVAVGPGGVILQSENFRTPQLAGKINTTNGFNSSKLEGEIGQVYRIQTTDNLHDWADWISITNTQFPTRVFDTIPSGQGQRFYRLVGP